MCTAIEVQRYWRRVGRALLDRIDLRCPVGHSKSDVMLTGSSEDSVTVRQRVLSALAFKHERQRNYDGPDSGNRDLRDELTDDGRQVIHAVSRKMGFSSRAIHSALNVARSISDLAQKEYLDRESVSEAVQHRRLGEQESVWQDWQSSFNNESFQGAPRPQAGRSEAPKA